MVTLNWFYVLVKLCNYSPDLHSSMHCESFQYILSFSFSYFVLFYMELYCDKATSMTNSFITENLVLRWMWCAGSESCWLSKEL